MNFFISKDGQNLDPYSIDQIQKLLAQNKVAYSDLIWADGWSSWLPISQIPGISEPMQPIITPSSSSTNTLCAWMHLSQFTAFIIVFLGYVVPIIIWQANKKAHPNVDKQGRIIANWIISSTIYDVLTLILCCYGIGFFILPILMLIEIAFPIIGAVKASRGEVWNYPMSINFFPV